MHPQIISFRCTMMNQLGKVLSFSYNKEVINQLGEGDPRLTALIEGLQSVKRGEKRRIPVPADRAYGPYDPALSIQLDFKEFPRGKRLSLGSEVVYPHPVSGESIVYRVVKKTPIHIVLEGNHPLAGLDLIFEVEIVSARKAKQEDVELQNLVWLTEYVH